MSNKFVFNMSPVGREFHKNVKILHKFTEKVSIVGFLFINNNILEKEGSEKEMQRFIKKKLLMKNICIHF